MSLMRVCQPSPLDRNTVSTSASRRSLTASLVTAAFGRPRNLACNDAGSTSKRTDCLNISSVHSGFSSSIRSGLGFLFIPFYLTFVRFAKADHTNACFKVPIHDGVRKNAQRKYAAAFRGWCADAGMRDQEPHHTFKHVQEPLCKQ